MLKQLQTCPVSKLYDNTQTTIINDTLTTYYAGIDLYEYIKKNEGRLDNITILYIFIKIVDAIRCIHNYNIYHLDIKLHNIVINPDNYNITIIDFEDAIQNTDKTQICSSTTLFGTGPPYMNRNLINKFKSGEPVKFNGFSADLYALSYVFTSLQLLSTNPSEYLSIITEIYQKIGKTIRYYRNIENLPKNDTGIYKNLHELINDLEQLYIQQQQPQQQQPQQQMNREAEAEAGNYKNTNRGGKRKTRKTRKTRKHVYKPRKRV